MEALSRSKSAVLAIAKAVLPRAPAPGHRVPGCLTSRTGTRTSAEFKRHLPALLGDVALLNPFKAESAKARELGLLAGRGKPVFKDWAISEEDFLVSR